jgi:uncharacterized membrane protein required for colicin V production
MMSLASVFWLLLIVFAIVGGFRGWAKEILVVFSMITALAIDTMLTRFLPPVGSLLVQPTATAFYIRAAIVLIMAYFGYQTPNLPGFTGTSRFVREKLQDWLLGSIIGLINGYLIVGSLWFYMSKAQYNGVEAFVIPPENLGLVGIDPATVLNYLNYMPPVLLGYPTVIFAVVIAFVFVIIVFV